MNFGKFSSKVNMTEGMKAAKKERKQRKNKLWPSRIHIRSVKTAILKAEYQGYCAWSGVARPIHHRTPFSTSLCVLCAVSSQIIWNYSNKPSKTITNKYEWMISTHLCRLWISNDSRKEANAESLAKEPLVFNCLHTAWTSFFKWICLFPFLQKNLRNSALNSASSSFGRPLLGRRPPHLEYEVRLIEAK